MSEAQQTDTTTTPLDYDSLPAIEPEAPPPEPYDWAWAPLVFGLLTLFMFFDVLFSSQRVVSAQTTDLALQFIPWRDFGFSQLAKGNLPLWNPHIFGGAPYFAGFQAALLYPPNWLHLILPLGMAINWIVALHVFLAGYFTNLWCRGRHIGVAGSILAGIMFMYCGPYFNHLYAGHLPHLAVMVWTPLLLLTIDKLSETGDLKWCLLGISAATMHILAGHPQYVYYTGMTLTVYMLIHLFISPYWVKLGIGFVIMYVGAVLLSAVQLMPGLQAAGEQIRSVGLQYATASTFSLPPQNFITLFAPDFFGPIEAGRHWGAGYLWETSIFISITGLALAIWGVIRGHRRSVIIAVIMVLFTLILALGRHTPLYRLMFNYVPGYGSFRGTLKFGYICALFVSMLAGMGFDSLRRRSVVSESFITGIAAVGIFMAGLATVIWLSSSSGAGGAWAWFVTWVIQSASKAGEWFRHDMLGPIPPAFFAPAGRQAALCTFLAAAVLGAVATLFWTARLRKWTPYLLIVLAGVELFIFARHTRDTMSPALTLAMPGSWSAALRAHNPQQRVLMARDEFVNAGLSMGFENVNGYDPGVLRRYAELLFASQGLDPAIADQYVIRRLPAERILQMLRCDLMLIPNYEPVSVVGALPIALLVTDWEVFPDRASTFGYMMSPNFNPSQEAVLEANPGVAKDPSPTPAGVVKVIGQTTDTLELRADLDRPAVLVVTNNYSTGWRLLPLKQAQPWYRIVPANYVHMGIPLEKGSHHFILEYSPLAFRIGRWVSLLSILGFITATVLLMRRSRQFR